MGSTTHSDRKNSANIVSTNVQIYKQNNNLLLRSCNLLDDFIRIWSGRNGKVIIHQGDE